MYIAENCNHVIRYVDISTGVISTFAGTGNAADDDGDGAYSGDGGDATSSELNYPVDVAVDSSGK